MLKSTVAALAASLLLCGSALATDFHTRIYKTTSTFTIPSNTGSSTDFEFTTVGAGGGAAGNCGNSGEMSGGGAGAVGIASFSGFNIGDTVTITVGTGGAAGGSSGGSGGTTKITYAGVDIATATGGTGSSASGPGVAGTYTDTVGTTGLTRHSTLSLGAQNGEPVLILNIGGNGGTNSVGVGGVQLSPDAPAGGGGGAGCSSTISPSGAGGDGYVIIHWGS